MVARPAPCSESPFVPLAQIEYAGTALTPNTAYTWRVRWWDNRGDASPWSRTAKFTTGLFSPEDWAGAQWIGLTDQAPGNQLRTTFVVPSGQRVTRATAFVVGLGYDRCVGEHGDRDGG